ncbi:uncharacterized protein M437DRAFT_66466 [Aureobasidium melanogenum CBS 110374]|uniref:Uncharacterized protein n=1 Tax=Aureobasidium melanogenum (strain CBS 110374) TaxID=1043003 RepID=A0A074VPI2_AURM1|nr:uncharacterized protein M437DRAFT_66466 [Aureobasidium melanogenum CBS 110374]KEQ62610.1 hypothetical protein M437DRAFT_66466 [Aureobasidium melanogenum CBS 110374]
MSSILAKVGLTASASFVFSRCCSSIAPFELLARCFHSSQSWYTPYNDRAAKNAKAREKYANDPEYRKKKIQQATERNRQRYINDPAYREYLRQATTRLRARNRPEHVQKFLNDAEYRNSLRRERLRSSASTQKTHVNFKENVNNCHQRDLLFHWVLNAKWRRRLVWETHEPLVSEEREGTPGRLWWRRKKVGEKSAGNTDEQSSEQMLNCHSCFCDMDWEKALPLGYRGHVFGSGKRLKQPDWDNYPPPSPSSSP